VIKKKMPLVAYAFFTMEIIYIKWTKEKSCHEMDRMEFRGHVQGGC
jgi:hypothetical protein